MGWKIYKHTQPSGRIIYKLAFYHKRTKTLHVLKGKIAKLNKRDPLHIQLRYKALYNKKPRIRYMVTQLLPQPLCNMDITTYTNRETCAEAISRYKATRSYIKHTMYLPNGMVIPPPPLSIKAVPENKQEKEIKWLTLSHKTPKPTKE